MAFSSNKLLASSDLSTVFKLDGSESDSVRKTDRQTDRQTDNRDMGLDRQKETEEGHTSKQT